MPTPEIGGREAPVAGEGPVEGLASAPEFFVEGYRGVMLREGVVKLNFFSLRFDPAAEAVRPRAALTLSMPERDFHDVVQALSALSEDMKARVAVTGNKQS